MQAHPESCGPHARGRLQEIMFSRFQTIIPGSTAEYESACKNKPRRVRALPLVRGCEREREYTCCSQQRDEDAANRGELHDASVPVDAGVSATCWVIRTPSMVSLSSLRESRQSFDRVGLLQHMVSLQRYRSASFATSNRGRAPLQDHPAGSMQAPTAVKCCNASHEQRLQDILEHPEHSGHRISQLQSCDSSRKRYLTKSRNPVPELYR